MKYLALLLATSGLVCAEQFVTGQAARLVVGQETFTRQLPGASERVLGAASGVAFANDTLIVADSSRVQGATPQNHRVLIYRNVSSKFPDARLAMPYDGRRCPVCGYDADVVLGQPDFSKTDWGLGRTKMRTPTGVATDGRTLAVADTDNNRVLIWHSIPAVNNQPPDNVIGQSDFDKNGINFGGQGSTPSAQGLRGPQGVWIDDRGRLWVADTQNHRVLRWNQIPRENGKAADLVLGTGSFSTYVEVNLVNFRVNAQANNMINPVSVTTDPEGRVYVADLGHNRVMIWNSTPNQNGQPVDIVIGQPDVASTDQISAQDANNSTRVCAPTGQKDADGKDIYPALCAATLSFPRYALSDGKRLFIADGGNDRVLVFNSIPTRNGQAADVVLGQLSDQLSQDSGDRISAADSVRTPMALAWDGANLFVSDPFNRRLLAWTSGDQPLPITGVRNLASQDIFAIGAISFSSDPAENDETTVKIGSGDTAKEYKYKAKKDEKIARVIRGLVEAINAGAGDPQVFATPNEDFAQIILTARISGAAGNEIEFATTFSENAKITTAAGSGKLSGGQDAAKIAPGSLVMVVGENLADREVSADPEKSLPKSLGGVEVYIDGSPVPLLFVSPTQINAQMPWDVNDASSVSAYVRTTGRDGKVRVTTAIAVPIIPENPGIFAESGTDPRPARAFHGSSFATGVVSVDGTTKENDVATITVEDRSYSYTVKANDTLETVRQALVDQINANEEERVMAIPSTIYTRILLRAKVPGPEGNGVPYGAKASDGGNIILTPLSPALCCANQEGTPITEANPAVPGEIVIIYGTGLGFVKPDEAKYELVTGEPYKGPVENSPNAPIDAIAGGKTANVLFAGAKPGTIGIYELRLQLNSDIPTNPFTQMTIAQDVYISNIVTFPVVNPNTPTEEQQP